MPFKTFPGKLDASGNGSVIIQQDNASVEWDIYQISVNGSNPTTNNMICTVLLNSFLLCNSPAAAADTATGPPDVILSRGDTLTVNFTQGISNDNVNVGIWFDEAIAGSSNAGAASNTPNHIGA